MTQFSTRVYFLFDVYLMVLSFCILAYVFFVLIKLSSLNVESFFFPLFSLHSPVVAATVVFLLIKFCNKGHIIDLSLKLNMENQFCFRNC